MSNWKKNDPHQAYQRGRSSAKRRGHRWNLEEPVFLRLYTLPCHYCRLKFPRGWGTGLDQMLPGKGYTEDNVVPCCGPCNRIKSDVFSYEEMKEIGAALAPVYRRFKRRKQRRTRR